MRQIPVTFRHKLYEVEQQSGHHQGADDGQPSWNVAQREPAGHVRRQLHSPRDEAANVRVAVQMRRVEGDAVVARRHGEPGRGEHRVRT